MSMVVCDAPEMLGCSGLCHNFRMQPIDQQRVSVYMCGALYLESGLTPPGTTHHGILQCEGTPTIIRRFFLGGGGAAVSRETGS